METPFMEVIRFDVENVIATSGGHSWDSVNQLLTCPKGNSDYHFKITEISISEGTVFFEWYTNGNSGDGHTAVEVFKDPAVDNWYVRGDEGFIKCNDGK